MTITRKCLLVSLGLHVIVLLWLILPIGTPGKGSDANKSTGNSSVKPEGNIIDKPEDKTVDVDIVPIPQKDDSPVIPEPKKSNPKKCIGFGGIGVEFTGHGLIMKVYKGYPADKAGLQVGDTILLPNVYDIRGEPGTQVSCIILRGSKSYEVVLTRELICTDKDMEDK